MQNALHVRLYTDAVIHFQRDFPIIVRVRWYYVQPLPIDLYWHPDLVLWKTLILLDFLYIGMLLPVGQSPHLRGDWARTVLAEVTTNFAAVMNEEKKQQREHIYIYIYIYSGFTTDQKDRCNAMRGGDVLKAEWGRPLLHRYKVTSSPIHLQGNDTKHHLMFP